MSKKHYDIFLSYSSQDMPWVSEFVSALSKEGVTAWFDAADIAPGEKWQDIIQQALRESATLVMILSPDSAESPWMFFELGAAVADKKRIIPVIARDVEWSRIPRPLQQFQFLKESSPTIAGKRVAEVLEQQKKANNQTRLAQ